jgi:hypothetical protein
MPVKIKSLVITVALFLNAAAGVGVSDANFTAQKAQRNIDSTSSMRPGASTALVKKSKAAAEERDSVITPKKNIPAPLDSSWWTRKIDNPAINLGERLEFSVRYGRISAGTAVMEISDTTTYDSHLCYRVVSTASSNDFVSVFYKVRDTVETYIDIPGIFPRKFRKHLREGNYQMDRITTFDQRRHLAITGNDTVPTYAFVQDPLSSLYYIRTQKLIPGKDVMIDNHTDKKNYLLKVIVYRKERIEVPAGTFDCVVIEPVMRAEGIFKAKGRIWIWLTDDEYKMPVMMKSEVYFLGSVSAQLSSYRHGKVG